MSTEGAAPPTKRARVTCRASNGGASVGILSALCDDELACVLSYLSTREAICLSETCKRTRRLLMERSDAWGPLLDLGQAITWDDAHKPAFAWQSVETVGMPEVVTSDWDRRWLCRFKRLHAVYARFFDVDMPDVLGRLERLELSRVCLNALQSNCGSFDQMVNLVSLCISNRRLSATEMGSILVLPKLQSLVLGPGAYAMSELAYPSGPVAPIETLDVSDCWEHAAVGIGKYLARMPIKKITCSEDNYRVHGLEEGRGPELILRHVNCALVEDATIRDNNMWVRRYLVGVLSNVRRLALHVAYISDTTSEAIFAMPNLLELDISNKHYGPRHVRA